MARPRTTGEQFFFDYDRIKDEIALVSQMLADLLSLQSLDDEAMEHFNAYLHYRDKGLRIKLEAMHLRAGTL